MTKITLEDENKTIINECECAFACLIGPAGAPEASEEVNYAKACMLGETNMKDLARAVAKCAIDVFDHMSGGDEDVKNMAIYELLSVIDEEVKEDENPAKDVDVEPLPTGKGWG
jgi:hypothetical protein